MKHFNALTVVLLVFGIVLFPVFGQANELPRGVDLSRLSTDEIRIYQSGEISTGQLIGGGAIGTVLGFGLGHIVYEEYTHRGWIFTAGELGSLMVASWGLANGIVNCTVGDKNGCGNGLGTYVLGAMGFIGFRIWEAVDVWTLPSDRNSRYRAIRSKLGLPPTTGLQWSFVPGLMAASGTSSFAPGASLTLQF